MLAMFAIIELQKRDKEALAIWHDAEFSFSPSFFRKLGGDPERLIIRRTNKPVDFFDYIANEVLESLQEGVPIKAIVLDSVRALRYPREVNKKTTEDMLMGGDAAAYLGSAIKLILPVIANFKIMTIFVQQVSQQMDPMKALRNPYIIPSGNALKHAADVMLEIVRLDTKAGTVVSGETITGSAMQVGHKIRVRVKKNRLAVPYRVAQFTIDYNKGVVDIVNELFDLAKSLNVIKHPVDEDGKENTLKWQLLDNEPVRGEDNMRKWIIENPQLHQAIYDECCKVSNGTITERNTHVEEDGEDGDSFNVDLDKI
jgi:recombination protein RecA